MCLEVFLYCLRPTHDHWCYPEGTPHPPPRLLILPFAMGRSCLLTRSDVFALIADGGKIVIKDDAVLRLDGWLEKHPGGRLAILHMVGRDATDELNM